MNALALPPLTPRTFTTIAAAGIAGLVARPLAAAMLPALPWYALATGYGVVLWVFTMYVVASLVAAMPPFLEFGPVACASLFSHLALGIALGTTADRMAR